MRLAHCWPTPRMNVTCSPRFRKGGAPGWACGCSSTLSTSCAGTAAAQPRYPIDHEKIARAGRVTATHGPGKATSAPEEGNCVLVGDKHLGRHLHGDEGVIEGIKAHHLLHLEGAFVIKTAIPLAVLAALTNWRVWGIELPLASEQWDWQHWLPNTPMSHALCNSNVPWFVRFRVAPINRWLLRWNVFPHRSASRTAPDDPPRRFFELRDLLCLLGSPHAVSGVQWQWVLAAHRHGSDLRCFGFRRDQFRHMLAGQRSKNPVFDSGR